MLDPVITLGIEHVLLIVKGPGLSPSLPLSPWSFVTEEEGEADCPHRHHHPTPVNGPVSHLVMEDQCGSGQR